MSNTIRYEITQLQLDIDQNVTDEKDYVITSVFTASNKGTLPPVINGATWIFIPFGNVASGKRIKLISDKALNIRINNGVAILAVTDINLSGTFSALAIQNLSGDTANIEYAIYG